MATKQSEVIETGRLPTVIEKPSSNIFPFTAKQALSERKRVTAEEVRLEDEALLKNIKPEQWAALARAEMIERAHTVFSDQKSREDYANQTYAAEAEARNNHPDWDRWDCKPL